MGRDVAGGRELAWRLFVRDTAAQYRQSALGYFWVILPPLMTSLIFILLNSANVLVSPDLGMSYPVYVLTGTVFFGLFSDGMAAPLRTIVASRALLIKVSFPREALLLAAWAQTLLGFVIRIALLAVCLVLLRGRHRADRAARPHPRLRSHALRHHGGRARWCRSARCIRTSPTASSWSPAPSCWSRRSPMRTARERRAGDDHALQPADAARRCARATSLITGDHRAPAGDPRRSSRVCLVLFFIGWVLFRLAIPILVERLGS